MQHWIFSLLILHIPLSVADRATYPEATETQDERRLRYESIAADIAAVVPDRDSARLLVAIAVHESGLDKDVDVGPCAAERVKKRGCDSGRSKTIFQLYLPDAPWPERREAASKALKLARHSQKKCAHLPPAERLAAYAGGRCDLPEARRRSREIMALVRSP